MITVFKFKIKKVREALLRTTGASLAEFAVVSALMATLAATSMPKLSALIEKAKAEKTMKEIDKILSMGQTYFNSSGEAPSTTSIFPGQEKHTVPVGDYAREVLPGEDMNFYWDSIKTWRQDVENDLQEFDRYNHPIGSKWRSVFGLADGGDGGHYTYNDIESAPVGILVQDDMWEGCHDCSLENQPYWYGVPGWFFWRWLFSYNHLSSPFQDGHYIYIVIPGGNFGGNEYFPQVCVADLENPRDFHKWLTP